jgi:hypothetical protein
MVLLAACASAQERPVALPMGKADNARLAEMYGQVTAEKDWQKAQKIAATNRDEIMRLLDEDKLTTANDFYLATNSVMDPLNWYENARFSHEMAIMALMYGHKEGANKVKFTWDLLMRSLGRPQRFGSMKYPADVEAEWAKTNSVPAVVATIFADPEAARKKAAAAKNSEEMRKLRDEDQSARKGPMTQENMQQMAAGDRLRHKRLLEIIEKGQLYTGADFEAASLLLQHGGSFQDYAMAHELSLAAIILGYDGAAWLVSRTYDRMLLSVGHRQRFGTQWSSSGLSPMDPTGVGDRHRLAMNTYKLKDLLENQQAILKRMMGG